MGLAFFALAEQKVNFAINILTKILKVGFLTLNKIVFLPFIVAAVTVNFLFEIVHYLTRENAWLESLHTKSLCERVNV